MNENIAIKNEFNAKKERKIGFFQKTFANRKIANLIGKLDGVFIKLPHLPKKVRLFISKIVPFLALLLGIVAIVASLISGFFLVLSLIAWDFGLIMNSLGGFLFIFLDALFLIKAFRPLRKNNAVGWIYLFWAQILEVINLVINGINQDGNWWIGIIAIILGFYLLFEIGQFYVYRNKEDGQLN